LITKEQILSECNIIKLNNSNELLKAREKYRAEQQAQEKKYEEQYQKELEYIRAEILKRVGGSNRIISILLPSWTYKEVRDYDSYDVIYKTELIGYGKYLRNRLDKEGFKTGLNTYPKPALTIDIKEFI
jgi:hypothetical protein